MDGPTDGILDDAPEPNYDYDQLADVFYHRLRQRDATRLGWLQMTRWSPLLMYYLGIKGKAARRVFSTLYQRGHFIDRRLAPGRHPSYLFLQTTTPVNDAEGRAAAIKYWRWVSAYSQGSHIPPSTYPLSPLKTCYSVSLDASPDEDPVSSLDVSQSSVSGT
jgi:hypothetical protein